MVAPIPGAKVVLARGMGEGPHAEFQAAGIEVFVADAREVVDPRTGEVLATRELLHPHATEQPFNRSLDGVRLPGGKGYTSGARPAAARSAP